jgi:hypothetical protein
MSLSGSHGVGRTQNVAVCNLQLIRIASNPSLFNPREPIRSAEKSSAPRGILETEMTTETKTETPAKPDLNSHYRPLGLKAVAAAALMQAKPKTPKTA